MKESEWFMRLGNVGPDSAKTLNARLRCRAVSWRVRGSHGGCASRERRGRIHCCEVPLCPELDLASCFPSEPVSSSGHERAETPSHAHTAGSLVIVHQRTLLEILLGAVCPPYASVISSSPRICFLQYPQKSHRFSLAKTQEPHPEGHLPGREPLGSPLLQ